MNKKLLDKIINEVSLDERVSNGMFSIAEDAHMEALREYLVKKGLDEEAVKSFSNRVLEGKYPERQAFNQKGILVTFPTPEYKQAAIKRGTHFEKDPTKAMSNLFGGHGGTQQAPQNSPPAPAKDDAKSTPEPKTNLPVSQASATPAKGDDGTDTTAVQPQTTAAPQQTPTSAPAEVEPVKEPTELPPPPIKSPEEKEADKQAIKQMLKGDDYMLEEVAEFIKYNAPYIMEMIKKKM